MRPWEIMALDIYRKVFVASPILKELILASMGSTALESRIVVTGLPFDSKAVLKVCDLSKAPAQEYDVVYSSRWDLEKQPAVFVALVESNPELKFAVCTGREELEGSDDIAIRRALELEADGKLKIFRALKKPTYYAVLSRSRVQFNCSLQDWVSFTLLEGLTFGCQPLYPNFRSFPETLVYSEENLYAPGNIEDASEKLRKLLKHEGQFRYRDAVLQQHDSALTQIAQAMID